MNDKDKTMKHDEDTWVRGNRAAWTTLLSMALGQLSVDDPEAGRTRWILEREATVAALRQICEDHGDNDWPDNLYLPDVIEKHLEWHLNHE